MSSLSLFLRAGGLAALSVFLTNGVAIAQCGAPSGPDVIVGDITGPANYTAAGTLEALSLGTTSCNIGTANISWIANNNLHPVIGGNLYRFRTDADGSGRFEQVGMSWLKHGFTALTQNLCCTCSGQGGSVLGVGCADPYTASRNGSQSGLGPRYQVNAHTGVFAYPPATGTGGSGNTYRRLQVDIADLDTAATTRWWGETHYVTQDDATAGNQNNNTSYREMTVSGSGSAWNFAFLGATVRSQSAIRVWPSAEPGAQLVDVQVPGDGLFVVGYKVTPIAGGLYHYEYAIHNLNSDRCGGSFQIPANGSVNASNIGFHDVSYRDGDGNSNVTFSGADWAGLRGLLDITWACATEGTDPNANAIRWGTTYNFRFDCDAAPVPGTAILGLWKAGAPADMSVAVDVPGTGLGPPNYAYCFGDGSGTGCPCGNSSPVGAEEGCQNSLGYGAHLGVTGLSSISADTLSLNGSGMPNATCLYFQGTLQTNGGLGANFGDGLRCASGPTVRLGTKLNAAGASAYPVGADLPVSVKGGIAGSGAYTYQVWYRNSALFCVVNATFNLSNGYRITWIP